MRTQSLLAAWNDTRTRGPFLERSPGASSQVESLPAEFPALSGVAQKRHLLRGSPSSRAGVLVDDLPPGTACKAAASRRTAGVSHARTVLGRGRPFSHGVFTE